MGTEIRFDQDKFKELVLYIASHSAEDPTFGATKLNKILYFSDFWAYVQLGAPVTGATYQRLEHGPAPRQMLPVRTLLFREGAARIETRPRFNLPQRRLVALREPNLDVFSKEELLLVDEVIDALRPYSAVEVSELSHQLAIGWQLAEVGEEIPYQTAFLTGEAPTEDDIYEGQIFAKEHGLVG
jgi:uncharacterized phage-associated protein